MVKQDKAEELKKISEWQHKMYDPGHYLGGNIHPAIQSKSKLVGSAFIFLGLGALIVTILGFVLEENRTWELVTLLVPFTIGLLFLVGGIRKLK